jgi:hypothetical protein
MARTSRKPAVLQPANTRDFQKLTPHPFGKMMFQPDWYSGDDSGLFVWFATPL